MANSLLPEVSEKYILVSIRPGNYRFPHFGEIDLRKISLKKADDLFYHKFPYLKLKKIQIDNPPEKIPAEIIEVETIKKPPKNKKSKKL